MEFYRMRYNKKMFVVIFLLIIINGAIFCNDQMKYTPFSELISVKRLRQEYLVQLNATTDYEEMLTMIELQSDENETEALAKTQLYSQLEYLNSYEERIEKIMENANQLKFASLFGETSSNYAKENIVQTVKAYSPLKTQEIELGNDQVINGFFSNSKVAYINLMCMILIILQMAGNKKKSLNQIVFATPRGRSGLSLHRSILIILSACTINAINLLLTFVLSVAFYGGTVNYSRTIQSVSTFSNFTYQWSVGETLFFYYAMTTMVLILLSSIIWVVIILVQNLSIATFILSTFFVIEFMLSKYIMLQSNLVLLKSLNVAEFIRLPHYFGTYYNLNILDHAVVRLQFVLFASGLLLLIFLGIAITLSSRLRPCDNRKIKVEVWINSLLDSVRNLQSHLGITSTEAYKVLIINKGFLLIIIASFFILNSYDSKSMKYTKAEEYLNEFYSNNSGKVKDDIYILIEQEYNKISVAQEEYTRTQEEYNEGNASELDLFYAQQKLESYQGAQEALPILEKKLEQLTLLEENKSITPWLVNERVYNKLLGEDSIQMQRFTVIISLALIVLLFSGSFDLEKRTNMIPKLRQTAKGRSNVLKAKMISSAILTFIITTIFYVVDLYYVHTQFRIGELGAPIQSLDLFYEFPLRITIWQYLLVVYMIKCIVYIAFTELVVTMCVNIRQAIVISILGLVMILPILITYFGFDLFEDITFFSIFQVNNMVIRSENWIFNSINFILLSTVIICTGRLAYKKWCRG